MSISEKRSAASRANGAKSRGPLTVKGKAMSSANSLRHGMLSNSVVLDGESTERFSLLLAALHEEFAPRNEVETMLLETMAVSRWRQMRFWGMEKAGLTWEIHKQIADSPEVAQQDGTTRAALAFRTLADESRSLDLMNRYEARYDRQYNQALCRLIQMRSLAA
jgi:hypothetical protein